MLGENQRRNALQILQGIHKAEAGRRKAEKMKTTVCPICGLEMTKKKPNTKYCSLTCKELGRRISLLRWKKKNTGYMTKYMKRYRQKGKSIK